MGLFRSAWSSPRAMPPKTVSKAPKVPAVPESVLKKRKTLEKIKAERLAKALAVKKASKVSRKAIFKKAEQYVKEYKAMEKSLINVRRQAKQAGNYLVEPEPKLLFVTRIRGINKMPPQPKKILDLLRLRQIHNGVFLKNNKATMNMLRIVQSYITFGEPNLKTVRELVYKRGFGKVNKQRLPLTDNSVIEGALGKYGIVCVEDLIHEIYTVGPNFKQASNFLRPFKLSSPTGGYKQKGISFTEGGDYGNRDAKINNLVRQMN